MHVDSWVLRPVLGKLDRCLASQVDGYTTSLSWSLLLLQLSTTLPSPHGGEGCAHGGDMRSVPSQCFSCTAEVVARGNLDTTIMSSSHLTVIRRQGVSGEEFLSLHDSQL